MMSSGSRLFLALALTLNLPFRAGAQSEEVKVDSETFAGLEARAIGPATMGGRIAAIDAVEGERLAVWVGSASGGLWKSVNGGMTFKPVFDKHTQSIGAVAIDPSNPETVWVGTGESWVRNSVSVGTGVYRTTDGGENWERMGLPNSERISRIAINPKDGKNVFVCATGALWSSHPERGVFNTLDGGKTWEKALFVDPDTGCADLAMDPQEPRVLYAAMWQFRRKPWTFSSGGPQSGLYKSTDGGKTWRQLRKGIPQGELGRIGLAVAPSRPSVVYAVIEAKKTALFRSDDLGESWTEMSSSFNVQGRPFYFAHIVVDPNDHNRVYKPGFSLTVSDDGGKTFSSPFIGGFGGGGGVHPDHHALWINPKDANELIVGTDGGIYVSRDRGNRWRFAGGLPVSQFYHVSFDDEHPYNVYGGLQDNGTWYGPSRSPGGIANYRWKNIGGGDGFWAFVDPTDPDTVFVEYQGGNLLRIKKSTGETKEIKPFPGEGEPKYRFNWNTPIHMSPSRPGTMYYGSQFLLRSANRGESWERISPDLTTNDPAKQRQEESGGLTIDNSTAEDHCTIYAIAESPKNPDVIWAGTDDGNLQLTRDGGKSWTNVAGNAPGLNPHTWVSFIEASRHQEATAYATFDGHRTGDMKTYVYRTADYGKTWQPIATPDVKGYAHVLREDLVNPNLLFLGTEFGLFVSLDTGGRWAQFTGGLPNVAVHDIVIHPRESDLILATHGRGIYIVDDLTPLRELSPRVLSSEVALLGSRPAALTIPAGEQRFDGDDGFEGRGAPEAAVIHYYQKKRHIFGDLKLEIYDSQGKLLSTIAGSKRRGINRVEWPMRLKPPKIPPAVSLVPQPFAMVGPRLPEGTYSVKLIKGKETLTSQVRLVADPRSKHSAEDRALQQRTALKLYGMLERLTYVADAVVNLQEQTDARSGKLARESGARKRLFDFRGKLESFRATLVATKEGGMLSGEQQLRERLVSLYGGVNGYDGRPTDSQLARMAILEKELEAAESRFEVLTARGLPAVNASRKGDPLKALTREEWAEERE